MDTQAESPGASCAPEEKASGGCSCCSPKAPDAGTKADRADVAREIRITVRGGYSPARVTLTKGVTTHLVFAREEASRCSEELLIPEFGVRVPLAANAETILALTPTESGTFGFSCGMRMLKGELVVA